MYHIKMAFVLVQVGTNLWVNPMQVVGISAYKAESNCATIIIASGRSECSDWTLERVQEALKPAAVAKALEGK